MVDLYNHILEGLSAGSAVTLLKLLIYAQGILHFHFSLGPTNYAVPVFSL